MIEATTNDETRITDEAQMNDETYNDKGNPVEPGGRPYQHKRLIIKCLNITLTQRTTTQPERKKCIEKVNVMQQVRKPYPIVMTHDFVLTT